MHDMNWRKQNREREYDAFERHVEIGAWSVIVLALGLIYWSFFA